MSTENQPSISQQLNDLLNPKPPEEYDPENEYLEAQVRARAQTRPQEAPDLGQRRILPDIPLDPKIGVKKTSRAELEKSLPHPEEDEDDLEAKEGEGEDEDDDEESESGSQEGKEEKEEEKKQEVPEEDLDAALKQIAAEDQTHEQTAKVAEASEAEKGRQVIVQRKALDCLVGVRILMEKMLTIANKLPQPGSVGQFQENLEIKQKYTEAMAQMQRALAATLTIQTKIAETAGIANNLAASAGVDEKTATEADFWGKVQKNRTECKDKVYDNVENWMEKTQLFVNARLKQGMKALGTHPLRQAEDKYDKNKEKFLQKTQLKAKAFRVLGNPVATVHEMRDKEIYEDSEYYQTFLRDYLSLNAKAAGAGGEDEGLDWTYRYLQSRGMARKEKTGLQVEGKKRKNKALKYTVHDKLVNFMAQQANPNLLPGYENIVKSLFGTKPVEDQGEPAHTRKRLGTDEIVAEMEKINTKGEEDVDVALI